MAIQLSNIVSATVSSFIEYALFIVTIMIIWYIIKFFLAAPPTKEEKEAALQGQREAWGGAIKKVKEKGEERRKEEEKKREQQRKRNLASPVVRDYKRVLETAEKAEHYLNDEDPVKLKRAVKELNEYLHDMWTHASQLRGKVRGEDHQKIQGVIVKIQTARQIFGDKIKGKIPDAVTPTWRTALASVGNGLQEIQGLCGDIYNELEKFEG